jgi:hypothetical protein
MTKKKVNTKLSSVRCDVCKSVHHHTIQIIQPTRYNSFTSLLLDVYVWLNMFRASPRPSSGAYNCTRSLWFYRWREAAGTLLVVVTDQVHTTVKRFTSISLKTLNSCMFRTSYLVTLNFTSNSRCCGRGYSPPDI